MSAVLELMRGDTFEDEESLALFTRLADGPHQVIASDGWDGGWGHHDVTAVVLADGKYWLVTGGGCSCQGSASIEGPYLNRAECGHPDLPLGDNLEGV